MAFLHSLLALAPVTTLFGAPLSWLIDHAVPAVCVGYGSHLLADMMTLRGVQLFWPSRLIAILPGRDECRVATGGNSERVFVALALVLALLFYPVSRVDFDGLIYRLGGFDELYGTVSDVTVGDPITSTTRTSWSLGLPAPATSPTRIVAGSSGCAKRPRSAAPGCGERAAGPPLPGFRPLKGWMMILLYPPSTSAEGEEAAPRRESYVTLSIPSKRTSRSVPDSGLPGGRERRGTSRGAAVKKGIDG